MGHVGSGRLSGAHFLYCAADYRMGRRPLSEIGEGRSSSYFALCQSQCGSYVGVIGVVIFSPSYVSALYEGKGYSERSEPLHRNYALESNALEPGALTTLSSPALVTIPLTEFATSKRSLWPTTDLSSLNLYTGATNSPTGVSSSNRQITTCLALVSFCHRLTRPGFGALCYFAGSWLDL